jgi:hypothetical protein
MTAAGAATNSSNTMKNDDCCVVPMEKTAIPVQGGRGRGSNVSPDRTRLGAKPLSQKDGKQRQNRSDRVQRGRKLSQINYIGRMSPPRLRFDIARRRSVLDY